jgi:hypothetical protein
VADRLDDVRRLGVRTPLQVGERPGHLASDFVSRPDGSTPGNRDKTGKPITSSYLERRNATFRACLAGRTRRGRRLVVDEEVLAKGLDLVGCVKNFGNVHRSLRSEHKQGKKWRQRTPAMAAGWTDHVWSLRELLSFRVLHA